MLKIIKKNISKFILASLVGIISCSNKVDYSKYNFDLGYKKIIEDVKTIEEAKDYCTNYLKYCYDIIQYGKGCWVSFKRIHKSGKDDCDGGAVAAAALLSDDGYPATILRMYYKNTGIGHAVFLYKEEGKYGSIGIDKEDCNKAEFSSVDDLICYLNREYGMGFDSYTVLDFSKYINELIESDEDLDPIYDKLKEDADVHYLK